MVDDNARVKIQEILLTRQVEAFSSSPLFVQHIGFAIVWIIVETALGLWDESSVSIPSILWLGVGVARDKDRVVTIGVVSWHYVAVVLGRIEATYSESHTMDFGILGLE